MNENNFPELSAIWDEARQQIESGNINKAIEIYKYILVRYADEQVAVEFANAYLGDLYLTIKNLVLAEEHIRKAISLKPDNPGYRYILGFVYTRRERWNEAISEFEIAVKHEPGNGEYLRGLGWAVHSGGDINRGLALLKEANRLAPENTNILADLAVAYMMIDADIAKIYAEKAIRLDPANTFLQNVLKNVLIFRKQFKRYQRNN